MYHYEKLPTPIPFWPLHRTSDLSLEYLSLIMHTTKIDMLGWPAKGMSNQLSLRSFSYPAVQ